VNFGTKYDFYQQNKYSLQKLFSPDAREKPRLFWRALERQQELPLLINPEPFAPTY
jgi:hypothetical protein